MSKPDRAVTERDFRRPEFYDADPADYEFRNDGSIARKDRWETGIRRIASRLGIGNKREEWEISDVVDLVTALIDFASRPDDDVPPEEE